MGKKYSKEFQNLLDNIEKMKQNIITEFQNETNELEKVCDEYATQVLYEEAVNLYDSLIEQYYRYETKSYYRHNAGVGTGYGENLYYGKNFYIDEIGGLNIEFSGEQMEKYRNDKKVTREEVLNIVKAGYRGVPGKWLRPWSGSFEGDYFGVSKTNIDKAFELFEKNYNHMYEFAFKKKLKREKKSKKYKYWK